MKIKLFVAREIQYFELGIFSFNSYVYYLIRGSIASTSAFNLLTCAFNLLTPAFSLPTRTFNVATRAFSVITREFEPVTRQFKLVTHEFELVTCESEPVTRGFELVTRVLLLHKLLYRYDSVEIKFALVALNTINTKARFGEPQVLYQKMIPKSNYLS